ncbi:MAG TPA: cytochrome c oxidase accessory protein CcoG [Bacteroidia bacterium]|nr:cytochrome c oxidase accessory protein CcoG [Bacteroidia bacterium]
MEANVGSDKLKEEAESFRDSIATINKAGKRNWIFPKQPHGRLYTIRSITSIVYLVIFFTLPFIKVDGDPLFMFNILERKFIFFGVIFWPQDFFIFGIGMLTFIVFIVLFTVVFGRAFCGWACPQTIFMEMVFRKIEYWVDGDFHQQQKLRQQKWDAEKIRKRIIKLGIFFFVSVLIANTFLSYIIGVDEVLKIAREPIADHAGGFIGMIVFSSVFFGVYTWFREQVCLIVCPYGRLQGVMLDKDSIVVAYDYVRGEPRGKIEHNPNAHLHGDCVDCSLCVKVCPTGIDIRHGTQLECVNCTACIDACDEVMTKTHKPKGLIRYASENGIKNKVPLRITTRIKAYSFVLLMLIGVLTFLLITRSDVDATVLRAGGELFQEQPNDKISNLYTVRVINKTRENYPITFKIESGDGEIQMVGKNMEVAKESKNETEFFIIRDKNKITERKSRIKISVWSGDKKIETVSTTFLGPVYDPGEEKEEHHDDNEK